MVRPALWSRIGAKCDRRAGSAASFSRAARLRCSSLWTVTVVPVVAWPTGSAVHRNTCRLLRLPVISTFCKTPAVLTLRLLHATRDPSAKARSRPPPPGVVGSLGKQIACAPKGWLQ